MLDILLEQLIVLRKAVYFLLLVSYKRFDSETAWGAQDEGWEGHTAPTLSPVTGPSQQHPESFLNLLFQGFCFTEVILYKHN